MPTLVDGDVVVYESMAINLYLARAYGGELWPGSIGEQTRALTWSFWVVAELEETLLIALRNRALFPPEERDPVAADAAEAAAGPALGVLEDVLRERECLLGSDFTVADLNVASIVILARFAAFELGAFPSVGRWLDTCFGRPAARSASGRVEA